MIYVRYLRDVTVSATANGVIVRMFRLNRGPLHIIADPATVKGAHLWSGGRAELEIESTVVFADVGVSAGAVHVVS